MTAVCECSGRPGRSVDLYGRVTCDECGRPERRTRVRRDPLAARDDAYGAPVADPSVIDAAPVAVGPVCECHGWSSAYCAGPPPVAPVGMMTMTVGSHGQFTAAVADVDAVVAVGAPLGQMVAVLEEITAPHGDYAVDACMLGCAVALADCYGADAAGVLRRMGPHAAARAAAVADAGRYVASPTGIRAGTSRGFASARAAESWGRRVARLFNVDVCVEGRGRDGRTYDSALSAGSGVRTVY